jgi:hypothetical protein
VFLALAVLLGALCVGWAWGGSLGRLGDLSLRESWLVVVALALQVGGGFVGGLAYPLGLVISALLVLVFLSCRGSPTWCPSCSRCGPRSSASAMCW